MKLLFVCTHNACRSILAEVIARHYGGGRLDVASAGSGPTGQVHPLTLQFLEAGGYSTQNLSSKSFDDVRNFAPDVVLTVCDSAANESCPAWLGGAAKVHWGLPDPSHLEGSEQDRARGFDQVMSILKARIEALLKEPVETLESEDIIVLLQKIGAQH
jgi:arsenate reductase